MLRRILQGAVLLAAVAVAYQAIMGLVFSESQPMWSTGTVVLLTVVGAIGGYFDHRRAVQKHAADGRKDH